MNKFNYIIAAYFGERRTSSSMKTTEFFLDTHLDFFNRTKNPQLNRIIVVLNIKNDDDDDKLQTIKDKYKHLPIKYIVKYNIGGSYYNFELGLLDSLFFDPDVDYSFVIEDDYMPFSPNFYESFKNKMKEDDSYIYVSTAYDYGVDWIPDKNCFEGHYFPSISNGLFDMKKLKDILNKKNRLFNISNSDDYNTFERNQVHFIDYLTEYYKITGLCLFRSCALDESTVYDIKKMAGDHSILCYFPLRQYVAYYGRPSSEIPIIPIVFNHYFFRMMEYNDLEFFISIRNECSELLHDNSKFTIDDANKWYIENKPEFYIINYNNKDIGYFRTSNYSQEKKSIYIGCDLHKDFRGKKLAYNAYVNFIYKIFEKYDIDNIYLEVLENNIIAFNLYKKLGFIVENEKIQTVFRNNDYVNSILMKFSKSYLKKDYTISIVEDKLYVATNQNVDVFVNIYDSNDNLLYFLPTQFNNNSFWYSFYDILKYNVFKVKITDNNNNILFVGECKRREVIVVDAFHFFNELEMLQFRLAELNGYVDYFVIVEAKKTHSGIEKELFFENNKYLFEKYLHKIKHVVIDFPDELVSTSGFKYTDENTKNVLSNFKKTPASIRDEYQRNSISKGLELLKLDDDDMIIISDADEIINPDIILRYKNQDFDMLALEQDFYFYNLTYKYPKIWTYPKVVKYKMLKELTPEDIRLSTMGTIVEKGGWHFTYFFGVQNIIDKIKSFSHQEFNNDFYTDEKYIEECVKNGKYIFDDVKLEYIEIDNNTNLPKNYNLLLNNKIKNTTKYCFLITSYCDTEQKVEILNDCIDNLREISDIDICLHAHYPLSDSQKKVNHYIYDSSNPVLKYPEKYITWWKIHYEHTMNIYKEDYGYAVLQQWKRGFDFLKNLYDNIIIINYDVMITLKLLNKIKNKFNFDGCTFLHENLNTIAPLISINSKSNLFDKISIDQYKNLNGFAENFAEYLYRDSNCYRFNFNEYKDDYYTMIDFEGNSRFKDNQLSQHNSPYDSMNYIDFDIFIGEKDNFLNILIYNLKFDLDVSIIYDEIKIYDNKISNYILINTNLQFNQLDVNKLFVIVNNSELVIDKNIISYCKII